MLARHTEFFWCPFRIPRCALTSFLYSLIFSDSRNGLPRKRGSTCNLPKKVMNVSRLIRELSIGEIKVILNTLDSQHQFCKVVSKSLFISFFFSSFQALSRFRRAVYLIRIFSSLCLSIRRYADQDKSRQYDFYYIRDILMGDDDGGTTVKEAPITFNKNLFSRDNTVKQSLYGKIVPLVTIMLYEKLAVNSHRGDYTLL